MIIFRYLAKEMLTTIAATTGILMLIFMSTQFVHYLGDAAIGRFTAKILFHIMLLQIPYLLALLMPLGFFLALLLAYGRLHVDREMTVLFCSGMSLIRLLAMTLVMAIGVSLIVSVFEMWLSPIVTKAQKELIAKARSAPLVETMFPGRFFSVNAGKQVFYMTSISRDHKQFQGIFMAQHDDSEDSRWSIVTADNGYQVTDMKDGSNYLIVNRGHRYTGVPGEADFQNQAFEKISLRLDEQKPKIQNDPATLSTYALLNAKKDDFDALAELQWRISLPLSVFILAILAIPLSQVNPRQGKYVQLLPAVLIYIIYANMMFVARDWLASGLLIPMLGLWWLHGLLFLLAIFLFWYRSGIKKPVQLFSKG